MKKNLKIGVLVLIILGIAGASYYLYTKGLMNYLIVTGTAAGICIYLLIETILSNRTEETRFKSKLKSILKTYDSVLVKSKTLPKIDQKNIIIVNSIEDLVDAQMEIRKPIYYQEQTESCSFILLDNNEACIYILKQNDSVLCPLEITLQELEIKSKSEAAKADGVADEMLDNIDKTTIVRVKKGKYVKVSPIREKKKEEENKVEAKVEEVKEKVQDVKETVENKVDEVKNTIEDKVEEIKEEKQKKEKIKEVKDATDDIVNKAFAVRETVKEKVDKVTGNEKNVVEKVVNKVETEKQKHDVKKKVHGKIDRVFELADDGQVMKNNPYENKEDKDVELL